MIKVAGYGCLDTQKWWGITEHRLGGDMELRMIEELRREEQSVLEGLRATPAYQRLQALRQVLSLYDAPPPVGALLDALMPDPPRAAGRSAHGDASVIVLPGPRAEVA